MVNGALEKVQYESLPMICFKCGKYGHTKEICSLSEQRLTVEKERGESALNQAASGGDSAINGPWMVDERKIRRNSRVNGTEEMMVKLNDVVLNIGKHSAVIFKNNNNGLNERSLGSGEIHNWDCDTSIIFKGCGFEIRSSQMRSGKRLNRTIRDCGERFKVTSNSKVPLMESLNSIVELISTQLNP
uniref:CCHC-type domain-containing protein n=1 Tax=Gossypium raimondii TaxID=29730 RepID=A0A0D2SAN8_GOSRA|nr:hypothetical protein B456_005G063800 [Gossypium raimondii]